MPEGDFAVVPGGFYFSDGLSGAAEFEEKEASLSGVGGTQVQDEIVSAVVSGGLRCDGFGVAAMRAGFLGNGGRDSEEQRANSCE